MTTRLPAPPRSSTLVHTLAFLMLVAPFGCDGPSSGSETDAEETSDSSESGDAGVCGQDFPVRPADDFAGDGESLTIRLDAGAPVDLPEGSRLSVVLWGYDERWADFEATQLRAHVEELASLPYELALAIPSAPHEQVPAPVEEAVYYLSVYVELDGDDQACAGDYGVDWDAQGGLNTFALPLAEGVDVPLKLLDPI